MSSRNRWFGLIYHSLGKNSKIPAYGQNSCCFELKRVVSDEEVYRSDTRQLYIEGQDEDMVEVENLLKAITEDPSGKC